MKLDETPDYVGPDIKSWIDGDSSIDEPRILVLARPRTSRENLMDEFERYGALEIEEIASESVRAHIHKKDMESILQSSALKAIEIERPVVPFDQGN